MKKFIKNNQAFICIKCSKDVSPHPTSSRDHCNNCLYGLHVDINPGDRANLCRGELIPSQMEIKNGKTKIMYTCKKCKAVIKNIIAPDDNIEQIIKLVKISNKTDLSYF